MVKKIFLVGMVLALIGVCTGVYLWYKPHPKAENARGIVITAAELSKQYTADEPKANASYLDKVVEVTGTVAEIANNQDGAVVITLDTGDPMAGVLCTMRERSVTATKGQTITIKGFCRGNNLGVVLNDCVIK